jgi:putative transposase
MAVLAYEAPKKAGRPISQWTGREIADELVARGIVAQISPRHAAYLLKKWRGPSPLPILVDVSGGRRKLLRAVRCMPAQPTGRSRENARSAWMN